MSKNPKIKISSNRSFGLVFFIVFLIIALWPLLSSGQIRIWSLYISLLFLILGIMNSKLLAPINFLWAKLGILLGSIFSPIVMGFIFFVVVTPIGFFMRIIGKDLLRVKSNKKEKSYWIKRDKRVSKMKQQF